MKKKNVATVMAAALTLGAMPAAAFAAEAQTVTEILDVRLAGGHQNHEVKSRTEIYNTNNTNDRKDDTLKSEYKSVKILAEKQDKKESKLDKFAIAKTTTATLEVNRAKADIETAKAKIEDAKKEGATITKKEIASTFNGVVFTEGRIEITVAPKTGNATKYVFNGVDGLAGDTTVTVESLQKIFTDLNDKLTTDVTNNTLTLELDKENANKDANYADLNRVKYAIESNIAKFDVAKDEVGTNNENLKVTLYKKDAKQITENIALTLTLNNVARADKELVKAIPAKTDFTGHWAEEDIVEAMLQGHVDATGTFRPKSAVTRAEFAKMVCTVFNIQITDAAVKGLEEPFVDVKKGDWYYNAVTALYNTTGSTAKKGAVIGGYEDETFKPKANITRQEAAKMVAAAIEIDKNANLNVAFDAKIENNDFDSSQVGTGISGDGIVDVVAKIGGQEIHRDIKTKFKDDKEIGAWADEAVAKLSDNTLNVIGGNPDGTFKPKAEISRVEALLMISRAK